MFSDPIFLLVLYHFDFLNIRHAFAVVHQNYEPRVTDEDILRGNPAIIKCIIPSFVADYVHVVEWITDEESLPTFSINGSINNYGNGKCCVASNVPIRSPNLRVIVGSFSHFSNVGVFNLQL